MIGQGEGSKQKFLAACTFKLSNNNTRDLKCADVRPGSITGSIIVDIKGAPKNLDKLVQELKTDKSFALNGYADLTVDKVDVISVTTTTKNLTEKEIWEQIIKYLMENVGILVGIIVAAVLVLVIIGISIFLCYKCCTCCKCCKRCKCKRGVCCQSCQKDEEDCKELEMSSYHRTETLVESQLLKQQEGSQTMVMSNPVVVDVAGGSTMPKATVVVTDAQMIEKSDVLSKSNIEAGAQSNPQQLDEENAEIANTPDNAAGQAK